jgi:hypothetical protein
MQDDRTRPAAPVDDADKRLAVRRRAKRGLIAGYIHEISGRHAAPAVRTAREVEPAPQPANARV